MYIPTQYRCSKCKKDLRRLLAPFENITNKNICTCLSSKENPLITKGKITKQIEKEDCLIDYLDYFEYVNEHIESF